MKWEVNVGAVMGQMSTGGGHDRLNETLAIMDVPGMSKKMYLNPENKIGDAWADSLAKEVQQAGMEEKQLAVENNEIIPAIRVTVDGGWPSKSSTSCKSTLSHSCTFPRPRHTSAL